jgi:2'-5' RNA ligase
LRSFISLNIDNKNKENIEKIQNRLKQGIEENFLLRFENPKNYHLTLFFIGEIQKDKLTEVYNELRKNIENKFGKLNFTCNKIDAFPDLKKPKVLFLNCINAENKIFEIAEIIKNVLKEFGFLTDKVSTLI